MAQVSGGAYVPFAFIDFPFLHPFVFRVGGPSPWCLWQRITQLGSAWTLPEEEDSGTVISS